MALPELISMIEEASSPNWAKFVVFRRIRPHSIVSLAHNGAIEEFYDSRRRARASCFSYRTEEPNQTARASEVPSGAPSLSPDDLVVAQLIAWRLSGLFQTETESLIADRSDESVPFCE
jgi:hypothetical protein